MYRQSEALASFLPRWQLELLADRDSFSDGPVASTATGAILFVDVSGFTGLTRSFAAEGKRGAEKLSTVIDSVFGPVTRIVASHGGDILVFAGDSAMAVWRVEEGDTLEEATLRALSAARVIQNRQFSAGESGDNRILLRSSVSAGAIRSLELGGVGDDWLFMVDGDALGQVVSCDGVAEPGAVTLSAAAAELAGERILTSPVAPEAFRLERLHGEPAHAGEFRSLPMPGEHQWPHLVPPVVLQRISQGFGDWLAEFRTASVAVMSLDHGDGDIDSLHELVRLMQGSIAKLEGQVYQCLVDDKGANLLATFGMPPFAHEDDAERCMLAAIDVCERLAKLGVASSIGIATGTIWSGLYGSRERRQYSIVGPAINLASRLMKLAEGRILCDATTARAAGIVELNDAGQVDVKGYDEPVPAFEAHGVRREPAPAHDRERFVGRDAERATIAAMIERLDTDGTSGFALVEGDTGLGKSTLVSRALSDAPASVSILFGSAEAIDEARPYAVWKRVFRELLDVPVDETPGESAHARILAALGERAEHAALLNVAINTDFPETDGTRGLTSELRAARTRAFLADLVADHAGKQPLLIVLEGGHWFDSHSWSLARTIAVLDAPVSLLVTTRPREELPAELRSLVALPENHHLVLGALSKDETLALIKARLGVSDLPRELGELIVDRAAGHPLFAEQLLLALGEAGVYAIDHDLCVLKGGATAREKVATDVAVSLGGIVLGRADRLSPSQQLAIKTASVIGMRFSSSMLAAVHPGERRETLLDDLDELVERRFLRRGEKPGSYAFDNALIRDVIYESLPFQQRQESHRAIAGWHEDAGLADSPAFWPVLAHHYRAAEVHDEATTYFEKAGAHALDEYANAEAVRYLDTALELGAGDDRGALLIDHGLANVRWSRHEAGRSSLERGLAALDRELPVSAGSAALKSLGQLSAQALRRLRSTGPDSASDEHRDLNLKLSRGYEGLVEAYFIAGEQLGCLYCALRALNVAERAGPSAELARGYASISALFGMMRLEGFATAYKQRALDTAEKVDDAEARAWALLSVGIYKLGNADWPVAREHLDDAAESFRALQHPRREHDCRISLSNLHLLRGDIDSAAREIDRCDELARITRDLRAEGAILRNRTACHVFRHDNDALADDEKRIRQFLAPEVALASEELEMLFALRALAASRLGRQKEAEEYADVAEAAIRRHGTTAYPFVTEFLVLAEVWLRSDSDGVTKLESLERLVRAHARNFPIGRPGHLWLSGRIALARGKTGKAERLFTKSARRSAELDMPFHAALAHIELADLAADPTTRDQELDSAQGFANSVGLEVEHVRIPS